MSCGLTIPGSSLDQNHNPTQWQPQNYFREQLGGTPHNTNNTHFSEYCLQMANDRTPRKGVNIKNSFPGSISFPSLDLSMQQFFPCDISTEFTPR